MVTPCWRWNRVHQGDPRQGHSRRPPGDATGSVAQSGVVGVMLLTAVIIILVSVVSLFVLSGIDTESSPTTDVEIAANATTVELIHAGGDDLVTGEVQVVFGRDGAGATGLENATETRGDGDGTFEGSERRVLGHNATETLSVRVVHEPTNTVVARELLDV